MQQAPLMSPAEVAKSSGLTEDQLSTAQQQSAPVFSERENILKQISDKLKANDFSGAFATATEAEQAGKGQFVENITNPDLMRYLRGPMTREELSQFYKAMPGSFVGEGNLFIPEKGIESNVANWGGAETGYADPRAALMAKPSKTLGVVGDLVTAALAPTLGPLAAAAFSGGQKYVTTGGDLETALKSAALTGLGTKVGELITAPGAEELTGVTTTAQKAAEAATKAASEAITSGVPASALQEIVVQAAKSAAPGLAQSAATAIATGALNQIAASGPEVTVETSRYTKPDMSNLLASTSLIQGTPDVPVDIYGRPEEPPKPEEPAKKEEAPLQTFNIEASRLPSLDVMGNVPALSSMLADAGYQKPVFDTTPVEQLPEVVVRAEAPKPIDLGDSAIPLITQGFTQPNVDPLTGQTKETPKTEQELDKIQGALSTGAAIPSGSSMFDKFEKFVSGAQKVNDLIKVLGMLGALSSGSKPKTPAPTAPPPAKSGLGALPKYNFERTQLNPNIDYYNYGFGPEAKFFSDTLSPAPATGMVNPKDQPVFAEGGLTGYSKGGSNSSRYVDGPGSGREDKIPALLSDGEYVIDAETLALLGDGSTKEGARRMDKFRANIRKHKGRALSRGQISPDAKSPDKYMGGGLA
jgi:hypothetical protein